MFANYFVFPSLTTKRLILLSVIVFGSIVMLILQNVGIFPLDPVSFIFFSFVLLLLALYRLGWTFLLFIAVLPLEVVNLAPASFGGLMIRPYQWVACVLIIALASRVLVGRLPFRLFHMRWFDFFPLLMVAGAFLAFFVAPVPTIALKQALVLSSFVGIYFLGRIFFRTVFDVKQALPFFIFPSLVVFGYALWQNVRALFEQESFQVMAGRPNATFSEADWLGMFTLLALGIGLALFSRTGFALIRSLQYERRAPFLMSMAVFGSATYLVLVNIVLIITVARSAWLGAMTLIGIFVLGTVEWRKEKSGTRSFREATLLFGSFACLFLLSAGLVWGLHLSPFEFLNRIQSTGSGLQEITIACNQDSPLPVTLEKIQSLEELSAWHCRHIRLEEQGEALASGQFITTVYRDDPNISIRKEIYTQVLGLLREHPVRGIGWGNISSVLGNDERGAGLNASNVFFEVWLGSGLLGIISFVILWVGIAWASLRWLWETTLPEERLVALFLLATLGGLTVFNLFNSGILLGFFFIFLSLGALAMERLENCWHTKKDTL